MVCPSAIIRLIAGGVNILSLLHSILSSDCVVVEVRARYLDGKKLSPAMWQSSKFCQNIDLRMVLYVSNHVRWYQ